jgi:predicted anti-sigma-YlaC factor YlaD
VQAVAAVDVVRPSRAWQPVGIAAGVLVSLGAFFVLSGGAFGEAFALLALYVRSDEPWVRIVVLAATLILVATAAAGPFLAVRRWGRVAPPPGEDEPSGPE